MLKHIEQHGLTLHKLGYNVVPIPAGSKGCFLKGWQTIIADESMISDWAKSTAGCGIRGPHTVGIDIDCHDKELTDYMLWFTQNRLGYAPSRVGKPPKALIPYRCEHPFSKIKSTEFCSSDGQKQQLEVLANGQQFVAAHIHPDTNKPYIWTYQDGTKLETLTVPHADLPLITETDARAIIAEFEKQCEERKWMKKEAKHSSQRHIASSKRDKHSYSVAEANDMLSFLDPDMGYGDWLRVGMALHHGGFPVSLWDNWSKFSKKYKEGECANKWASFQVGGQHDSIQ